MSTGGKIALDPEIDAKAPIHESYHEILHHDLELIYTDSIVREIEEVGLAFVVGKYFGLR